MSRTRSLTQRVRLALTGVVAVFVGVLVVLAFLTFGRMEDELVNDVLRHETERLLNEWQSGEAEMQGGEFLELGDALRAWIVTGDGPDSLPRPLRGLPAGMIDGLLRELNPEDVLRQATACGTYAVTQVGFGLRDAAALDALAAGVVVHCVEPARCRIPRLP